MRNGLQRSASSRSDTARLAVVLAAFALIAYGPELRLPFVGDDYVFLDRVLRPETRGLALLRQTDFGWWRPLSRELYFWTLAHTLGPSEVGFRLVGLTLWIGSLLVFARIVGRVAPSPAGAIAALGAAGLAFWGAPILWASGSQDLWLVLLTLVALDRFAAGRGVLAALAFAGALLGKETAAVLPVIVTCWSAWIDRDAPRRIIARTAPFWFVLIAWAAVHPTLATRFARPADPIPEIALRPGTPVLLLRTALAAFNADAWPRPVEVDASRVAAIALSTLVLAGGVVGFARRSRARPLESTPVPAGRIAALGGVWIAAGWAPLLLPSIGWHAYYGCLGALGVWLLAGGALASRPRLAAALLAGLVVLRGLQFETPSWDWGSAWYQRRAGRLLESIRGALAELHSVLPPHTRAYFGRVPNNIGLIAGQSPALRVWYRDSTLSAGFISWYRPRAAGEPAGPDLFFRFDSVRVLVEVVAGPEDVAAAAARDPEWAADHEKLAMMFLRNREEGRAAAEFEKLSLLRERADAALFASVCRRVEGDTVRSDSLLGAAAGRLGLPRSRALAEATRLARELPSLQESSVPPRAGRPRRP